MNDMQANTSNITNYTRGGQTFLRQTAMFGSINSIVISILLFVFLGVAGFSLYKAVPIHCFYNAKEIIEARFLDMLPGNKDIPKIIHHTPFGKRKESVNFILRSRMIAKSMKKIEEEAIYAAYRGGAASAGVLIVIVGFFIAYGKRTVKEKYIKGTKLVSVKELNKQLKKVSKSRLNIGGVEIPEDYEKTHTLLLGTTGSGKTTALHHMLRQIRARGEKAVIVDTNAEMVSHYYREGKDIILNPFDARSQEWNLWSEINHVDDIDNIVEGLVPNTHQDSFWTESGKTILESALAKMNRVRNNQDLCALLNGDLKEMEKFFKNTPASKIVSAINDKTALSVLATLANHIKSYKYFTPVVQQPWSIKKWIEDENDDSWLFLSCIPSRRTKMRPLFNVWLSAALRSLMDMGSHNKRRRWFIIDELASMNRINSINTILSEIRKYGGAVVAATQEISQLKSIYGQHDTDTIMSLFNIKMVMRMINTDTARYISSMLGSAETVKIAENSSYGMSIVRDGVSTYQQNVTNPVIKENDIMNIENLSAFIKIAAHDVSRIDMEYVDIPKMARQVEERTDLAQFETTEDNIVIQKNKKKKAQEVTEDDKIDEADNERENDVEEKAENEDIMSYEQDIIENADEENIEMTRRKLIEKDLGYE